MRPLTETLTRNNVTAQKGILRTYINVIPRHFRQKSLIPVEISSSFTLTSDSLAVTLAAGQEILNITRNSSGWIELNVTEGLQRIQSTDNVSRFMHIWLNVTLRVNCVSNKKVPITLVDPSSIPMNQTPRRLRLSKFQPMLLVYLSDETLKETIRKEAEDPEIEEDFDIDLNATIARKKRNTENCHLEDFQVNFWDIKLDYVQNPYSYNAGKCVGSCSHSVLSYQRNIATNHAKVMASVVAFRNHHSPPSQRQSAMIPCCVPVKYESMVLLVSDENSYYSLAVYPAMKVSECGCR